MKKIDVEITNVGGLSGTHKFTLHEGLNTIKAGNAVGKTSFQKAIELLGLTNQDLKGGRHYANLFGDKTATIKVTGDINCNRKFRTNGNDLQEAGGDPLVTSGKGYVSGICFATPENPLINKMLSGESIKGYIERFSDSEQYDSALTILSGISKTTLDKLSRYREDIAKIEETQHSRDIMTKEKDDIDGKLKRLPKMDFDKIVKDLKAFEKMRGKKKEITDDLSDTKLTLNQKRDIVEDLQRLIKDRENDLKRIQKKYPEIDELIHDLAERYPDVQEELEQLQRKIAIDEDKIHMLQENQESRLKFKDDGNGVCHACGQKLTDKILETFQEKTEEELEGLRKIERKMESELREMEIEREHLEQENAHIDAIQREIREKTNTLSREEIDIPKLEVKLESLRKQEETLIDEIKSLSKNADAFKKYEEKDELENQSTEKAKAIQQAERRVIELQKNIVDVDALQKKATFLDEAIRHMKIRKDAVVDAVRKHFNSTINDIYKKMGFKNVEDITITPNYQVTVTKKMGGREEEHFPLNALSASERVTLGVALLMVAKQEYLPTFPFFVIDEIVTSYDPSRFEKIKDFVKEITDYVLITQVSTESGIVIEHGA